MMPMGDLLMKTFNISPQEFSILVSSYTLSAGIVGFLAAFQIDRFDRKIALQYIYLGFLVGTFACAMASDYYTLLVARTLTGAFGGVLGALILAIVGDVIPFERRATAMSIVMAAFSFASVIGVPFGYWIAHQLSWQAPFTCLVGIGLILYLAIWVWIPSLSNHLKDKNEVRPSPFVILSQIIINPAQLRALSFMSLMIFSHFIIIPFLAPYMERNVGFEENQITYIYLIGGALTIFTSPIFGRLADRYGKILIFNISASLCFIPMILITHLPHTSIYIALSITSFFFVVTGGRIISAQSLMTAVVKPHQRGSFMSINSAMQQLASSLSAFVAGLIVIETDKGAALINYNYVGYLGALFGVLAILMANTLKSVEKEAMAV
jgi:predicted MFS family arabinose efflux permease